MSDEYVLAGDVGGTNLRVAAVARDGRVLHLVKLRTPDSKAADDIVEAMGKAAEQCIADVPVGRPLGFGLALAALINPLEGRILSSPNLPQLNDLTLASIISSRLGFEVVLENDATAAAIGEHWLGSSKNTENSIFVTLGTGIGGGLILHGRPYRGTDGTAGRSVTSASKPTASSAAAEAVDASSNMPRRRRSSGSQVTYRRAIRNPCYRKPLTFQRPRSLTPP